MGEQALRNRNRRLTLVRLAVSSSQSVEDPIFEVDEMHKLIAAAGFARMTGSSDAAGFRLQPNSAQKNRYADA